MKQEIKIGTRGSKLALVQVDMVIDALKAHFPDLAVDVVKIETSGDWKPEHGENRLDETAGGKGQFAKEIEQALLNAEIDCGIHSMKDMESFPPEGLVIDHMLPRADARDAFLANDVSSLLDLPQGATIGTSSVRRQAFILAKRPDLKVVPLRGNVPTRIEKLRSWKVDATILAFSGMKRLGLESEIASIFDFDEMVPAAGQGAIGIQTRINDKQTRLLFDPIHCEKTGLCVKAERAALAELDGSCHTPIGAYAYLKEEMLNLHVCVCSLDGKQKYEQSEQRPVSNVLQAERLGKDLGSILKGRINPQLLG